MENHTHVGITEKLLANDLWQEKAYILCISHLRCTRVTRRSKTHSRTVQTRGGSRQSSWDVLKLPTVRC